MRLGIVQRGRIDGIPGHCLPIGFELFFRPGIFGAIAFRDIRRAQPLPQLKSAAVATTVGQEIAVSDTNRTASTK